MDSNMGRDRVLLSHSLRLLIAGFFSSLQRIRVIQLAQQCVVMNELLIIDGEERRKILSLVSQCGTGKSARSGGRSITTTTTKLHALGLADLRHRSNKSEKVSSLKV